MDMNYQYTEDRHDSPFMTSSACTSAISDHIDSIIKEFLISINCLSCGYACVSVARSKSSSPGT